MRFLAVHTSFSNMTDAERVSRILIEEKLAACANILPAHSIYRWHERIKDEDEVFVILKTDEDTYPALERRILELHPYEVPMITATSISAGSKSYLAWLSKALQRRNKW
jgi:periplasmic divalent cation tolerance protein